MKLLIKVSDLMNERGKTFDSLENRLVRVPQELRDRSNLREGEFINLRTKEGKVVTLKVSLAYVQDAEADPLSAYVSKEIFDLLYLEEYEKKYEQNIEVIDNITLGCDPEFFLVDKTDGKTVPAYRLFRKFGQVGHDGIMMEIRPLPSTNEFVVADNIFRLIKKARNMIDTNNKIDSENIIMKAASYHNGSSAGFHLHFGLPYRILGRGASVKGNFQRQIVRALDYYVGIPSVMPEGQEDYMRRTAHHITYGKPGEMRIDNRTLEYRVPGGSLMRHPILTVGILGLGAMVIEDVVSRTKVGTEAFSDLSAVSTPEGLKQIYPNIPDVFEMIKIVCSKDLTLARKHIDVIMHDISQMVGYEKRKNSIRLFFKSICENTRFGYDIEKNWNDYYNKEVYVR